MPVINILSPHVADLIAAGEVVERPASVIKELVENSLDAGARNITVEIRRGGATYICVSDDGCGMAPEDAGVAFLRHATSKLADERGLEAISTMGFRGEALAAIASVSRIELKTRRQEDGEGCLVTLEAGDIQDMGPCGCPKGTRITVRDLFYNTPARLKFLKSDRAEAAACQQAALRCALGHPEVSVRFIKDGEEEFFSPGDNRLDSAIYTLLGRETAKGMLSVQSRMEDMRVSGFISSPAACRGSRSGQYFYCNGRFIKSALLQSAVEQAYKNTLLTGRFPACVLFLELNHASVDVNVHPAKTEVKFSFEKRVFDLVYQAVKLSLEQEYSASPLSGAIAGDKKEAEKAPSYPARNESFSVPAPKAFSAPSPAPAFTPPTPKKASVAPSPAKGDFFRSMSAAEYRGSAGADRREQAEKPAPSSFGDILRAGSYEVSYQSSMEFPSSSISPAFEVKSVNSAEISPVSAPLSVEKPVQNVEILQEKVHRIIGETMHSYILAEQGEELILIDKHAAHERMIFDSLKARSTSEIMSQTLLAPVTLRLEDEKAEILEENAALLTALGYEIEPFGDRDYIIRAVPADMDGFDAAASVEEICARLQSGLKLSADSARDEILHTVACKAAIKAGWDTDERELEKLVEAVISGKVRYCPHGRPVSVTLSRKELDKMFKRIL